MNTPEQLAQMQADVRQAEADAQAAMDYYQHNPGVPIVQAGHANEPLPITEPPAISGCHGGA